MGTRRFFTIAVAALALAGCGKGSTQGGADAAASCDATGYPCGPFGSTVGQVVANLQMIGRRDDNHNGMITDDPARPIALADYYGDKSVKVLALFVTTEWCIPCRQDQPHLVTLWNQYRTANAGVALLEVLVQDNQGKPADQATADRWATAYSIPFDMAFDASAVLTSFYDTTFPSQIVITTSDMGLQWRESGITQGALESAIDAALGK